MINCDRQAKRTGKGLRVEVHRKILLAIQLLRLNCLPLWPKLRPVPLHKYGVSVALRTNRIAHPVELRRQEVRWHQKDAMHARAYQSDIEMYASLILRAWYIRVRVQ